MNLIPYDEFQINESVLNRLIEAYADRKINEYFTQHGQFPDAETISSYHTLPTDLMVNYKKYFYTKYYHDEFHYEQEYGPSEQIEVSFNFSSIEENNAQILGKSNPYILGDGISDNSEDYQHKYWCVIVECPGPYYMVGMFTSLKDITISLNSIRKYKVYVYHRKSNYQYDGFMRAIKSNTAYGYEPVPFDNAFHFCPLYDGMDISSYSPCVNGKYVNYETQLEDKEYFGVVKEYTPQKGGVISGYVYTLNPRMMVTVSGLTDEIIAKIGDITFEMDENGDILANGNSSGITKVSDSLFTYLMTKKKIVNTLSLHAIDSWAEDISNPNYCSVQVWVSGSIYDKNGNELENMLSNDDGYGCFMCRNGLVNTLTLTVPPYGEYVDNGFEFDAIDD